MKKKGFLHGLLMMACCIVPMLALLVFLPQIKGATSGFNWSWVFLLLCPLMHILMMKGMHGKGNSCHGIGQEAKETKNP